MYFLICIRLYLCPEMEKKLFLLVAVFFLLGCCINPPECRDVQEAYENCSTAVVPYLEEVCDNSSYIDQECESIELLYKSNVDSIQKNITCIEERTRCVQFIQGGCAFGRCVEFDKTCLRYMETVSFELINLDSVVGAWSFDWMRKCRVNQPSCNMCL